ncbi:MAG TPA: 4-hydroxy-tetrahydrodipicolinate synthase [Flavobacteriales bacterium]|nr:4-hydroxy-tetrahydrodipicolinate synthase [Flavobacteriales bacterium]
MSLNLRGLGVAMITPFKKTGEIDYPALQKLTEHLIAGNTDYLVVQGTTGEAGVLTDDEKRSVLDFVLEINNKRKPVILGVGGNNTRELLDTFNTFNFNGVDGILSVSPYYNKPTQEGLYAHYKALNAEAPRPIILYNVPGRTGRNMREETIIALANDCKNIIGIKEASGMFNQIMGIIQVVPESFQVVCGDDAIALPAISVGCVGCISVIGNAFPLEFRKMLDLALENNFREAQDIHYHLLDLMQSQFIESNPSGIKEILKYMGMCDNAVRLPLVPVTEVTSKKIYSLLAECPYVKL